MWTAVYLCGLAASALATVGDYNGLEQLFGPADISAATGNGALTVCANPHGRISVCRWPSPSYHDQVAYRTRSEELPALGVAPWHGLMWGVRISGETRWLTGPPWTATQRYRHPAATIIETLSQWPNSDLAVTQTVFVHPVHDLLVAQVRVRGAGQAPELYWYANFAPCTRLIPELPVADWALDAYNDFAVFAEGAPTTIYHFRPHRPGADAWAKAERQAADGTLGQKAGDFGDGVWIGYTSPEPIVGFQCGNQDTPTSAFRQAGEGCLRSESAAVGQCNGVLALVPQQDGDEYRATVYVAFGANRAEVDAALNYAQRSGYANLARRHEVYWGWRVGLAALPATDDQELLVLCTRCLVTLQQAMDRTTGAMVRCPGTQPPLALDWARHGFWMTLALDMAGYRDLAEKHTLFYCETVRTEGSRGKPLGSLPAASYANHIEAMPHVILESDAAAWMLATFWRHALFLEAEERTAYLAQVWDAAERAAAFLAGWGDGRTGAPLHSFHPGQCRDARSLRLLLATFMGVDSALRIADALGREAPPQWRERKRDLNVLVLIHCVDDNGRWKLDQPIPFGLGEIAATMMPDSEDIEAGWLVALESLEGYRAARALCDIALAWRGKPDKLAQLQPLLKPVLANALKRGHENGSSPVFPDAATAALAYIAAMVAYGAMP